MNFMQVSKNEYNTRNNQRNIERNLTFINILIKISMNEENGTR